MLNKILFAFLLFALFSLSCFAQSTYNWRGNISNDWSVAGNWRIGSTTPTIPPGQLDNVFIGNSTTAFTFQPQVNNGYEAKCASVTLGTRYAVTLTVNGKLTISGDFTQKHNNLGGNISNILQGSGTVSCANFWSGDVTAPPTPALGLYSQTYTTLLTSSVTNLNVTNNLRLNSTSASANLIIVIPIVAYNVANALFYLDGGTMTIGNSIVTTNSSYVNNGSLQNLAEFFITAKTSAATLYLNGATPFTFDANGAGGVDFYNPDPNATVYQSTVIYNASVPQTVYTSSQGRFGVQPSSYQNLKFSNTGTKNIQSGTLSVSGNWDSSDGKIDAVTLNPTVSFQGTNNQTITDNGSDGLNGVVFKNVTFTNGYTKTLSAGNFSIASTGIITLLANTTFNANGKLTLLSDATSSAAVASIPSGCSITNNLDVQRYLSGGNTKVSSVYTARGYRMLSSPVNYNGTNYFGLDYIGKSALTGGPGSGFTVTTNNPTIYLYREDVALSNTTFNSGRHKGILAINNNTVNVFDTGSIQVPVGNGYIFYFVGNISNPASKTVPPFTSGPENTVITATGRLNQGDIPVNLWYTPAGATGTTVNKLSYQSSLGTLAGYNMIGNPYASTLDLDKVISDNTASITNTVYELYNVNPGQKYIAYNRNGSSDPNASRYVVSGQGFIVKARAANGSLMFHESQKAPTQQLTAPALLMGIPVENAPITGFYIKLERDSLVNDYCGIYFNENTSANYDDEDARDLDGATSQVYMSSFSADGVRTAINHLPDYTKGANIKLYVNAAANGIYRLKIEDIRHINQAYDIWLKDNFNHDSLEMRAHNTYSFRITRSDTSSYGENRFRLIIRQKPLPPYQLISFSAQKVKEGIKVSWKVYNEGDYTGFELQKLQGEYAAIYNRQSDGSTLYSFIDKYPSQGENTYRLKQNDINNNVTLSAPFTLNLQSGLTDKVLSVYPNPATESIRVQLSASQKQNNYTATIYDYSGIMVMQKTMNNGNMTQYVGQLKPGAYIFELSNINGEFIGRTKFIKKL
ncbi:T9SS type A sorting domain-containing protein [Mucilaginibacter litoreus]|uniref:T9SS type A sorting domain-containing protein n=1 Tax=Mucilaginibacter litoreus TaxID=1048221 RepID=A0ABW3AMK2_9SPHI